jgi:putative hemolysin
VFVSAGDSTVIFFSGSETGFYRVSSLQLSIKVHQGDPFASQLQRFSSRPERFVTTVLVGNSIANYMITVAIGLLMSVILGESTGTAEVVCTVVSTPIVFVFGELIPKSLYHLAPMSLLRRGAWWFSLAYVICLPLSYPLILLSRLIARMGPSDRQPLELVLSRTRLVSVLEAGQREGLLTELQGQLAENMMQVARHPVSLSMLPVHSVQGAVETVSRDQLLKLARRLHVSRLLLHPENQPFQWTSYVRVADILRKDQSPRSMAVRMPVFAPSTPKLEVLSELVRNYSDYGAIREDGRVTGIVSRRTLLAQIQRVGPRTTTSTEAAFSDKVAASINQAIGALRPRSGSPDAAAPANVVHVPPRTEIPDSQSHHSQSPRSSGEHGG